MRIKEKKVTPSQSFGKAIVGLCGLPPIYGSYTNGLYFIAPNTRKIHFAKLVIYNRLTTSDKRVIYRIKLPQIHSIVRGLPDNIYSLCRDAEIDFAEQQFDFEKEVELTCLESEIPDMARYAVKICEWYDEGRKQAPSVPGCKMVIGGGFPLYVWSEAANELQNTWNKLKYPK